MNAERRKKLDKIIGALEGLQSDASELYEQEQEAYDNLPEGLKASEKGEASQAAVDNLENATSSMQDAIDALNAANEAA